MDTIHRSEVLTNRLGRAAQLAAVLGLLAVAEGCAWLPLLVGAGAGAGGYAWYQGYLKKQYSVDVPVAATATERALNDLGFQVDSSKFDQFGATISGKRATGERFLVVMDRAGAGRTTVKVRVGVPGDRDLAGEVHKAIQMRL